MFLLGVALKQTYDLEVGISVNAGKSVKCRVIEKKNSV